MAILTPHFDLPFRFGGVVNQGTDKDLANCIYAIVVCPVGFRDLAPEFGTPDLVFNDIPVMKDAIKTSIAEQEPRAEIFFSEKFGESELTRIVDIALEQRRSA